MQDRHTDGASDDWHPFIPFPEMVVALSFNIPGDFTMRWTLDFLVVNHGSE